MFNMRWLTLSVFVAGLSLPGLADIGIPYSMTCQLGKGGSLEAYQQNGQWTVQRYENGEATNLFLETASFSNGEIFNIQTESHPISLGGGLTIIGLLDVKGNGSTFNGTWTEISKGFDEITGETFSRKSFRASCELAQ